MITRKGFIQAIIALFVAPKVVKASTPLPIYRGWDIGKELDCTAIIRTPIVASTAEKTDDVIFIDKVDSAVIPYHKGITLYRNDYTGEVIGIPANGWFYHGFKRVIRGWGSSGSSYMATGDPLVLIGYAYLEK